MGWFGCLQCRPGEDKAGQGKGREGKGKGEDKELQCGE